jgi:hypothetical protein
MGTDNNGYCGTKPTSVDTAITGTGVLIISEEIILDDYKNKQLTIINDELH